VVVQTHGQVRPEPSRAQAGIDVVLTRRVFRDAAAFLVLTPHEERDLQALGVDAARLHRIDNGVPAAAVRAQAPTGSPLVVYSSRLAVRKRPEAFVAAAEIVARHRPDARFELWGPDGGVLAATLADIERRGLAGRCTYRGATTVERAREHLADAAVFVLPSFAEPFPMALLEALSAGVPAVITDQTGLSAMADEAGAARITDGSPEQLAAAVLELVDDPAAWACVATAAAALAQERFAMPRIADGLLAVYRLAAGRRPGLNDPATASGSPHRR
jgi:glycosyltransferase involved in cell wall biosynthesis